MENQEIKELLKQILANQVVIFNQLRKAKGGIQMFDEKMSVTDLAKEADKYIGHLKM